MCIYIYIYTNIYIYVYIYILRAFGLLPPDPSLRS